MGLKYRSRMFIYMEILSALMAQPRLPTNLAQIANVNLARLDEYLGPLQAGSLVKRDKIDGHEVIAITPEGRNMWEDLHRIEARLKLAEIRSGQMEGLPK